MTPEAQAKLDRIEKCLTRIAEMSRIGNADTQTHVTMGTLTEASNGLLLLKQLKVLLTEARP